MVKLTALTALGLIVLATQAMGANVKIMPFGASIVGAPGCWRAILWKRLQGANVKNTDFVGSKPAPNCGFPYDGENEGHAGALATGYAANGKLVGWLAATRPDIVLMHVGTNDIVLGNRPTRDIIDAYSTLVDQMRESNPEMKILVSNLIPLSSDFSADRRQAIKDLNQAMLAWHPTKSTMESPIVIVDSFTGFNATTDTIDGEHPNRKGNRKLADAFFGPLIRAIRSVG